MNCDLEDVDLQLFGESGEDGEVGRHDFVDEVALLYLHSELVFTRRIFVLIFSPVVSLF